MPKILDLFCGAGGCSVGYNRAGFSVVGVDKYDQPNYPFEFIKSDVWAVLEDEDFLSQFDLIHASPPCQKYSTATPKKLKTEKPDLVMPIIQALKAIGKPYVIENVPGARHAGMKPNLLLAGHIFGLKIIRERIFELSPELRKLCPPIYIPKPMGTVVGGDFVSCAGHGYNWQEKAYKGKLKEHQDKTTLWNREYATGVDWLKAGTYAERLEDVNNAIPPVYTHYIGVKIMPYFETSPR